MRQLTRTIGDLSSQNEELNNTIAEMVETHGNKEQELRNVDGRIKSKRQQLDEAKKELEEARDRAQEVKAAARNAELRLMQIEEDSKAKEQSFSRYKEELASFLEEMNMSRKNYEQ